MACACKVNQEIDRIHKYYSFNDREAKDKQKMVINKKDALITVFIYLIFLPFIPLIFLYLFAFSLFSKKKMISVKRFLNFIHKVRNGK